MQSKIARISSPIREHLHPIRIAVILALLGAAPPAHADAPVLELPIDCQLGQTCWLVNFVDREPGPNYQDYKCGRASYNAHRGTDIAIANKRIMAAGVSVLAAAPGRVIGTRDGMPETTEEELKSRTNIRGRECGNGVTIRHANDWTTQYCHMLAGSVSVRNGDTVRTGDRLGYVGLSGLTQFPHIHLAVRKGDTIIDPFGGQTQNARCDPAAGSDGLWSASAAAALVYPGPQPFHLGFAAGKPDLEKVRAGEQTQRTFSPDIPALVFWAEAFTLRQGDQLTVSLLSPDRQVLATSNVTLDRSMARRYRFVGRKQPSGGWPVGVYTGRIEIKRGASTAKREATAIIE